MMDRLFEEIKMKVRYLMIALAFLGMPINVNAFSPNLNSFLMDGYIWVQPHSVNGVIVYDYDEMHSSEPTQKAIKRERDIFQEWASESRQYRYEIEKPNAAICLFRGTC